MMNECVEVRFGLPWLAVQIDRRPRGGYSVVAEWYGGTVISEDVSSLDKEPVKRALALVREAVQEAGQVAEEYCGEWLDKAEVCAETGYYSGLAVCLSLAEFCARFYRVLGYVDASVEAMRKAKKEVGSEQGNHCS